MIADKTADERKLFGTNGVRGRVNRELTPEIILKLAMATGTYFEGAELAVGCDGRVSGALLTDLVTSGLVSTGCQVWNLGLITTPALQFLTKDWDLRGSVMITASHNPPEYNGIKIMGKSGVELPHEYELEIERIYFESRWRLAEWRAVKTPLPVVEKFEGYVASVLENVGGPSRRKLKVLVDAANGVSVLATPRIIERMGGAVVLVNQNIDGTFPGRLPEPTPANLVKTTRLLPSTDANFGVAHDGDGDRAVFMDEHGTVCWGDQTFALIAKDFLESNHGGKIVTPISSSQMVEDIADRYGGEIVYTPVGSVYVSNLMLKLKAKLGGEDNGGIFYLPHVAARDGGITTAWIYKILTEARKPLSKLVAELPRYYIMKDKIYCPDSIKREVTAKVRELPTKGRVLDIDGIKVWPSPRSWILLRPSGTEPTFRIMGEAPTKGLGLKIVNDYKTKLNRIIKSCQRHAK